MKHIGNFIENTIHNQGRSVTWFAEQLGCTRVTVYNIFRRASIETEMLYKISKILQYNFFEKYSSDFKRSMAMRKKF